MTRVLRVSGRIFTASSYRSVTVPRRGDGGHTGTRGAQGAPEEPLLPAQETARVPAHHQTGTTAADILHAVASQLCTFHYFTSAFEMYSTLTSYLVHPIGLVSVPAGIYGHLAMNG